MYITKKKPLAVKDRVFSLFTWNLDFKITWRIHPVTDELRFCPIYFALHHLYDFWSMLYHALYKLDQGIIPGSPPANRFDSFVSGPQFWYFGMSITTESLLINDINNPQPPYVIISQWHVMKDWVKMYKRHVFLQVFLLLIKT